MSWLLADSDGDLRQVANLTPVYKGSLAAVADGKHHPTRNIGPEIALYCRGLDDESLT